MVAKVQPMRKDIPSPTEISWVCSECSADVPFEKFQYNELDWKGQPQIRIEVYPKSRYWNGYGKEVFCSVECSIVFFNKGNQNLHLVVDKP